MVATLATGLFGGKSGALSAKDAVLQAKEKIRTICVRNGEVRTLARDALGEKYLADIK